MMRHCLTVFILIYGTDIVGLETDVHLPFQVWHSGLDIQPITLATERKTIYVVKRVCNDSNIYVKW